MYTYPQHQVSFDKTRQMWRIDYQVGKATISAWCKTFGTMQIVMATIAPISAWKAA